VTILGLEQLKLPPPVNEILGTGDLEAVVLRRLYSHDRIPIALVTLYLPLPMSGVAYILAKPENSHETTYSIFEQQMGLAIKEARHVVKTVQLEKAEAKHLNMKPGSICLAMDRITYSPQGSVMELMSYIYPPDRMQFEITLPRLNTARTVIRNIYPGEHPA
jgi:GntR family transcriptional regulator